jgi:hypothetical protein
LGGTWDLHTPPTGGTVVTARIPLSRMLLFEPSPPPVLAA